MVILIMQNVNDFTFKFLFWPFKLPAFIIPLLIIISIIIGYFLGRIFSKRKHKEPKKENETVK
jgi:uncharacterized integral membrane protein